MGNSFNNDFTPNSYDAILLKSLKSLLSCIGNIYYFMMFNQVKIPKKIQLHKFSIIFCASYILNKKINIFFIII